MNSYKKAIILGGIVLAAMVGLLFWKVKAKPKAIVLTPEDMTILAESQDPQSRAALADTTEQGKEQRKEFAKFIRRILAIGQAAEAVGMPNELEVKRELELQRTAVIAGAYLKSQRETSNNPADTLFTAIKPEDVEAYFQNKANEARFNAFVEDLLAKNPGAAAQLTDERKKDLRQRYGQTFVAAQRGEAAGLDKKRDTELQLMFQRARLLTQKYAEQYIVPQSKKMADDKAIDAYIAEHPELDENKTRAKAEGILQRVKGGEDFAKLAQEFSDDPGSKTQGGELGWFTREKMVPEFSEAAFKLQPGQISDIVKSDFGFHIIQVEERRMTGGKDDKKANAGQKDEVKRAHPALAPQDKKAADKADKSDKGKKADAKDSKKAPAQPAPQPPAEPDLVGEPMGAPAPQGPQEEVRARHILIKFGGPQQPGAPPQSPREQAQEAVARDMQDKIVDDLVAKANVTVPDDFTVTAPEAGPQFPPGMGGPQGPPPAPKGKPEPAPKGKPEPAPKGKSE